MLSEGSLSIGHRTVTYLEAGDPSGPLVLHNHGGPSSRLEARLFDTAATINGLRFVCADRPGIGASDPQPGRSFKSWADDLLQLADSFAAQRFAVTGWSEGGPFALAAAAYLDPMRLVHVASIGGASYGTFGANWAARYQSRVDALGGRLALGFRPGLQLMYWLLGATAKHFEHQFANSIIKSVNAADRAVLADDEVMMSFLATCRECFRHGSAGLVVDATLLYQAWPFDLTQVRRPIHFWQGSSDTLVPEAINKSVADNTPEAIWHPITDGGHFIAVSHAAEILAAVANDLASQSS